MNSGNPILDKNLECINRYNPSLVKALLELPYLTNDIQLVETEKKEPNLTFNGLPLHSQNGAEDEAKELFSRVKNTKVDIVIIYGIGLGHLFKEFCDNVKNPIVLYEPNLEILRVTLELVDFSKELSRPKIQLASNYIELKSVLTNVYEYKAEFDLIFLDSYKHLCTHDIEETKKNLSTIKGMFTGDKRLEAVKGFEVSITVLQNFISNVNAVPLGVLTNVYKDKTAVIVSAGPSLDMNIEVLKKNRDKIIIFCVGPALKTLMKNGIKPDFLNIIEMYDVSGQIQDIDVSDINLIISPCVHKAIHDLKVKQKFLFPTMGTPAGEYWARLTGLNVSEYIERGTVSYQALSSAKMLGCKRLVLVGQDLAYLNNSCYSKDSPYSDLVFGTDAETGKPKITVKDYKNYAKHILDSTKKYDDSGKKFIDDFVQNLNNNLCMVKGISGEMIPTMTHYASFAMLFLEFASKNSGLELINTSMLGAQLDGFENMPLEKALEGLSPIEKVEFRPSFKYNNNDLINNLTQEKNKYEDLVDKFKRASENIYKLEREYKREQKITKNIHKYFDFASGVYDETNKKYWDRDVIYRMIVSRENNEFQYYLNTSQDDEYTEVHNIYNHMKIFFQNNVPKFLEIIKELEKQIELLSKEANIPLEV